jgi:hypothetical protein
VPDLSDFNPRDAAAADQRLSAIVNASRAPESEEPAPLGINARASACCGKL